MANIQVYKHGTDTLLGNGDGTVDTQHQTACINTWTKKAGLTTQSKYKLISGGKIYPDAICTAINNVSPVASFNNVE